MYQLYLDRWVRRLADGAIIPFDEANSDYQVYLAWLADGGIPLPYEPEQGDG